MSTAVTVGNDPYISFLDSECQWPLCHFRLSWQYQCILPQLKADTDVDHSADVFFFKLRILKRKIMQNKLLVVRNNSFFASCIFSAASLLEINPAAKLGLQNVVLRCHGSQPPHLTVPPAHDKGTYTCGAALPQILPASVR